MPASMAFGVGELSHQQQQQVQPPASFDGQEWSEHGALAAPRKRSLQVLNVSAVA